MPAGLPGDTLFNNQGNPNAGRFVAMDPLSGPKGAPYDARVADYVNGGAFDDDPSNISTGALSTGIGFNSMPVFSEIPDGLDDDYIPGDTKPDGTLAGNSTLMYIGGGKDVWTPNVVGDMTNGESVPTPYVAGYQLVGAGNGGSRDSGAETGFPMKMVTATGAVANGAAIEAGFVNRSGVAMVSGESAFGSASVANAVPA